MSNESNNYFKIELVKTQNVAITFLKGHGNMSVSPTRG